MLIEDGWSDLEGVLRDARPSGGVIRYVPNPGNAGDALIGAAVFQLFDSLGLSPVISKASAISSGDVVVYGGGGNLVPEYDDCARTIERSLTVGASQVVVLPQTVRGNEALLARLDRRVVIACRDHTSFSHVLATGSRAELLLAPDVALRLDVAALTERCRRPAVQARFAAELVRRRRLIDYGRWRAALRAVPIELGGELRVRRSDREARSGATGDPRRDVSGLYLSELRSRGEADFVARDLLVFLRQASRVVTDRLHVGIAAALVGCEVRFLDNSYGKIRAVYETSLRHIDRIRFESQWPRRDVTSSPLN